jgi:hypothetical protein
VEGVNGNYSNEMEVIPYIDVVEDKALREELRHKTEEFLNKSMFKK